MKYFYMAFLSIAVMTLVGCSAEPINKKAYLNQAHFWQRANVTEAIYMNGPKAQQVLLHDISNCVTSLHELQRLGALRAAMPADKVKAGKIPAPHDPRDAMADWETPERDGYMLAEHADYHNFETCMISKGWERVQHVPYAIAEKSRETYTEAILGQQYRTATGQTRHTPREETDWDELNN